jgi:hypothetical protein
MHESSMNTPHADTDREELLAMELFEQTTAHLHSLNAALRALREVIRRGGAIPEDAGVMDRMEIHGSPAAPEHCTIKRREVKS